MDDKNEGQKREPRMGVFDSNVKTTGVNSDKQNEDLAQQSPPKKDMEDMFSQHDRGVRGRAAKAKSAQGSESEVMADKINKSLQGENSLEDVEINDDDVKLAEKMIFDGFAETEVHMDSFPEQKFTICSTNAEELGIIDEIIFDIMKKNETEDGMVDIPQNKIQALRNAIFIALGYRGRGGVDMCSVQRSSTLDVIKKGIVRRGDLEHVGKAEEAEKISVVLKAALTLRARRVQQLPTPLIDFLSAEKYKFDKKMFKIMTTKGVVPKS